MHSVRERIVRVLLLAVLAGTAVAQQVPDRDYRPERISAAYPPGKGPVVCIDEAHFNFHTMEGRFYAFARLLTLDGFQVRANQEKFDARTLAQCRVLVISNAQPSDVDWNDYPYPTPSAFTPAEIAAVRDWVHGGGSLLLIADHMPLAGAAAALAAAFDVEFFDGFARREPVSDRPDLFTMANGGLQDHVITRGRKDQPDEVTSVRTFTGQAFRAPRAEPLLVFPEGYVQLLPVKAWQFPPDTKTLPVAGWLQGAVQKTGKGRAAFFGEAAMFSAQLAGPDKAPIGMNSPDAAQNAQFMFNLLHWLAGTL